jgi:Fe-S cluster assembly iron-binding protein IscA
MITVTERAKQTLGKALESTGVKNPEIGLRLNPIAPGEYNLVPDKEKEGDQVVEHERRKVLLIGDEISRALDGRTIDRDRTVKGLRLVIYKEEPRDE